MQFLAKKKMIRVNNLSAHLDFLLSSGTRDDAPAVIAFYDRSQQMVRAVGAELCSSKVTINKVTGGRESYAIKDNKGYDVYISPISYGKERFYHALAVTRELNETVLITTPELVHEHFHSYLMNNYELPLLKEWMPVLLKACMRNYTVRKVMYPSILGTNSHTVSFPVNSVAYPLDKLEVYRIDMNDELLKETVSGLLETKQICISEQEQDELSFTNMDTYFKEYGHSIVENLESQLEPLTNLNGNMDIMTLKSMRLYPQQCAQVNVAPALFRVKDYIIVNDGMGVGKTIIGASMTEAYHVDKYLRTHKGSTLKDVYSNPGCINYRAIVMAPPHLVSKWAGEISKQIPYAKATVLHDVSQLVDIKEAGRRRNGREFYVISMDFSKLSYQRKPLPTKSRYGDIMKKYCGDCGAATLGVSNSCSCGSKKIRYKKSGIRAEGMVCPCCNNILVPYQLNLFDEKQTFLDAFSFTEERRTNERCYYCGEPLWVPFVSNLGGNKPEQWYRATHYKNRSEKGTDTVWVHKKFADEYFARINQEPLNTIDTDARPGPRKIAPAYYISKQLKGYFDVAIFDEVHKFKGAGTAQGNAMHSLIKASKYKIALTGTIAGGYASDLFYLMYRLDPHKMKRLGYYWTSCASFVEKYGRRETTFAFDNKDGGYNSSSKGKQIGRPKETPGISPLIFTDILMDCTIYLDLADMSKYLPKLYEKVELVDIEPEQSQETGVASTYDVLRHYNSTIDGLKKRVKEKDGGSLLSSMLKYSLSFLDHPYGVEDIKHPKSGEPVTNMESFDDFRNVNHLTEKEKRLIEIVKQELSENRNCFVFAEFTGSPQTCVTHRLKELIETHCNLNGQVAILESSHPAATKREAWMHKRAKEGIKVFITNPRCVETGLDFVFKKDGVLYNYPTLIFFQMGYSLFTIWQASRRHYRLIQREECRTYYMGYAGTVQQAVISMIAQKMSATSAIQGKFSVEGLTAMAQGIDVRMKLAESLAGMDTTSGSELQNMFDVLQTDDDDESAYGVYRKMAILSEIIGEERVTEVISVVAEEFLEDDDSFDIYDLFSMEYTVARYDTEPVAEFIPKQKKKKGRQTENLGQIDLLAAFY